MALNPVDRVRVLSRLLSVLRQSRAQFVGHVADIADGNADIQQALAAQLSAITDAYDARITAVRTALNNVTPTNAEKVAYADEIIAALRG